MAIILITGGTGLVGKELSKWFLSKNHEVRVLSRQPKNEQGIKSFYWNLDKGEVDEKAFDGLDHIIHLAGANIAEKRWTKARKKEIIDSRIKGIPLIIKILKNRNQKLKTFIGASAIGIYGMINSDRSYSETDSGKNDFLSETCIKWEESYSMIKDLTDRLCVLRFGVVLSGKAGVLKKLLPLFQIGLGSGIGSGKQYMAWVDIEDLVSMIDWFLFNTRATGTYNAVSTEQINNQQFSEAFAKALSKPFFIPNVPAFILKLLFGEMANMLLTGPRVKNDKLLSTGFILKHPMINKSLQKNTSTIS